VVFRFGVVPVQTNSAQESTAVLSSNERTWQISLAEWMDGWLDGMLFNDTVSTDAVI
jgi:hypothetical protein